jgi:REase_MTES_1575
LKDYLRYAKSVSENNHEESKNILSSLNRSVATRQNDEALLDIYFEKFIQRELQKLGYQTEIHVGHSNYKIDLAVVDPDDPSKYILAIETDDQAFSSANSTRERCYETEVS